MSKVRNVGLRIVGCGGAGANLVHRLHRKGHDAVGWIAVDTDAEHLDGIQAPKKIMVGITTSRGFGSGGDPEVARRGAIEHREDIEKALYGARMVFVVCGMGGGSGGGIGPVVARLAKAQGAFTIGVAILPFSSEGPERMAKALEGLRVLREVCDQVVTISNDILPETAPKANLGEAFTALDELLMKGIIAIASPVQAPGSVNPDMEDVKAVLHDGEFAMVGYGESTDGDAAASKATESALRNPFLSQRAPDQAKGAMLRIVGGKSLAVDDAQKAADLLGSRLPKQARIVWSSSVGPSPEMNGEAVATVLLTGFGLPTAT